MDTSVISNQNPILMPSYSEHGIKLIWANDSCLYINVDNVVVAKIKGFISISP